MITIITIVFVFPTTRLARIGLVVLHESRHLPTRFLLSLSCQRFVFCIRNGNAK